MRHFPLMRNNHAMFNYSPSEVPYPMMHHSFDASGFTQMPSLGFPAYDMAVPPRPAYQGEGNESLPPYGQVISSGYSPDASYAPFMNQGHNQSSPYLHGNQADYDFVPNVGGNPYHQPMPNFPPQMLYASGSKPVPQPPSPFANPLQSPKMQQSMQANYPNPYPKQAFMQKAQPSGFKAIMNQFKTQDGVIDVTKMMNTAGQMMGTVNQMQNVFKGIGGIFKLPSA